MDRSSSPAGGGLFLLVEKEGGSVAGRNYKMSIVKTVNE